MALFVGIGGTTREGSSSEYALNIVMGGLRAHGHDTEVFLGEQLKALPIYDPEDDRRTGIADELVDALRRCDGLVIATPGYHGSVSGLIKNAIDYVEDLRNDERCYWDGIPVGCVAVAYGWQASVGALSALRDITHALRGWSTPYGAAINSAVQDVRSDPDVRVSLNLVADQVAWFAEQTTSRVAAV